jgi:hypothetical protein
MQSITHGTTVEMNCQDNTILQEASQHKTQVVLLQPTYPHLKKNETRKASSNRMSPILHLVP